jgi:hypothetical protein
VTPTPIVAVTVWAARSTVPCRPAGRTLIAEATAVGEKISVMVTTVPTGNKPFWKQYPAGTTKRQHYERHFEKFNVRCIEARRNQQLRTDIRDAVQRFTS